MDDPFYEKMKQFLTETGYKGDVYGTDLSFLTENKEFVEWFLNASSEDFVSKDDLILAEKIKKEGKFIESEERLDEILLQEYSIDVNGDCISDHDIQSIKDKISEVDENIDMLKKLNELSKLEYEEIKTELNNAKECLKDEESKMNTMLAEFISIDHKFNSFLHIVNNEYKCYKDMLVDNFLGKKPVKNFLMLISSDEYNNECLITKKKVLSCINTCHNNSSIPVSVLNTASSMCDSALCSTSPSDSDLKNLSEELSQLRGSLKMKLYNQFNLEAEEKALICCLQYLKELDPVHLRLPLADEAMLSKYVNVAEEENNDGCVMERVKSECDKFAEYQVTRVLINLYESKIVRRNEKLVTFDKFLKIIQRFSAIVDFLWMMFKTEGELCDFYHSKITSVINSLNDEFKGYLERKDFMEGIMHQRAIELPSRMNPAMKCIQNMLISSIIHNNEDSVEDTLEEFFKNVNSVEEDFLKYLKNIVQNSAKSYKDCEVLKRKVIEIVTRIVTSTDTNRMILDNFKADIKGLNDKISYETSRCIAKKEELSQNILQKQLIFLWVTFLIEPEKLNNILEK